MDKRSLRQRVSNLLRAKRHKVRDNMAVATISGNEVGDEPMEETETTFGSNAVGRSESTRSTRSLERTDYLNRTTTKVKRSYNSLPGNFVLRGTSAFKSRNKTVENRQKSSGKTYHLCFCCCAQVEDEPYSELEETKFEMLARPHIETDSKSCTGSSPGLSETTLAERAPGSDDRMRQEAIENMTRPPLGDHPSSLDGARVIDGAWGGASAILGCGVGPIVVVTEAASVYSVKIPLIVTSVEVEICTDELHDESQGDLCSVVVDKDYLFPNRTMDQVESDSLGKLEVPTLSRRSSRRQSISSNFELTRFRKRKLNNENDDISNDNNSDTISVQSFDISGNEKVSLFGLVGSVCKVIRNV
ncbi:hypothetical protein Bpfe_018249 [Biomphalaria pfeifferi]|uniref:Uncharacterized protein n=1 Tax=Biomphalaria pfeifferi TaxID=112525 RepID=A0AAD8BEP0_BIOPF|nr:hypothetical protein Bpfe_018249 [Biomphalaria pfeifferi]